MKLDHTRILIIKPSSLGDVVHTLPLVHAIKRRAPSARITWLVQQAFAGLLAADPDVDEVLTLEIPSTSDPHGGGERWWAAGTATFRTLARLGRHFREAPQNLVLDLHASFRSGLLALCNPGGRRIGFADAKELNTLFMHQRITVAKTVVHAVNKNLLFCDYLGCTVAEEDFTLHVSSRDQAEADGFLAAKGSGKSKIAYLNPAARWATKYWNVEAWAGLADRLIAEERCDVVLAGSAQDREYIGEIVSRMGGRAIIAAGALGLGAVAALLKRAWVYVGLDSGPMHMAAMAGTPVVALFGPTNPEHCGPYGRGHTVLRAVEIDCLGCRRRSCNARSCMRSITIQQVLEATRPVLAADFHGKNQCGLRPAIRVGSD